MVAAAAGLCLCLCAVAPAAADFPGTTGLLVYSAVGTNGLAQIWAMNPDGTGKHEVVGMAGRSLMYPTWSADGSRIAFEAAVGDLYVVDADGSHLQKVASDQSADWPTWSPDGTQLAFNSGSWSNLTLGIYRQPLAGGSAVRLSPISSADEEPVWSPLGNRVAFTEDDPAGVAGGDLWTMDALDGHNRTQLTSLPGTELAADFSPSGSAVVFLSFPGGNSSPTLATVNINGTGLRDLSAIGPQSAYPRWMPDGRISFFPLVASGAPHLYTMASDGTDVRAVPGSEQVVSWYDWQPLNSLPANIDLPVVAGTAQDGATLTSDPGRWLSGGGGYTYQWLRCASQADSCTPIAGANGSSYGLQSDDVGSLVRVQVTASNALGSTSARTATFGPIQPTPIAAVGAPIISGNPLEGLAVSASPGSWSGTPPFTYAYQWFTCAPGGSACVPILGEQQPAHTIGFAELGHSLRVSVTATNSLNSATAMSDPSASIGARAPALVGQPIIGGSAQVGALLSGTGGSWSGTLPITYSFQWLRCDAGSCSAIAAATAQSYTPTLGDLNHQLELSVVVANAAGGNAATSEPTAAVVGVAPALPATTEPATSTAAAKLATKTQSTFPHSSGRLRLSVTSHITSSKPATGTCWLEVLKNGRWTATSARSAVSSNGSCRVSVRFASPGRRRLRIEFRPTASFALSDGRPQFVTITR